MRMKDAVLLFASRNLLRVIRFAVIYFVKFIVV